MNSLNLHRKGEDLKAFISSFPSLFMMMFWLEIKEALRWCQVRFHWIVGKSSWLHLHLLFPFHWEHVIFTDFYIFTLEQNLTMKWEKEYRKICSWFLFTNSPLYMCVNLNESLLNFFFWIFFFFLVKSGVCWKFITSSFFKAFKQFSKCFEYFQWFRIKILWRIRTQYLSMVSND